MKTYKTNPELFIEGAKCQVLIDSKYIGADTDETDVWLPAEILEVSWGKEDIFKVTHGIPAFTVKIRYSRKYRNSSVDRMLILPSQVHEALRIK